MTDTMRNRAMALARRGFRVFPLEIGGKTPIHEAFHELASADEARVHRLWTDPFGEPEQWNIGLLTGWRDPQNRMLVALDVDRKDGRDGLPLLRFLQDDFDLPGDSLQTRTPSGGEHHVFWAPPGLHVASSAGKLGPGLDVRGWHGYIVGPGSVTPKGEYALQGAGLDAPIREIPPVLARRMEGRAPGERSANRLTAIGELDTEWAIARAQVYLEEEAPEAFGDGRKAAAFQAAQRVGDLGVSEAECLALMDERWNGTRCEPPLDPEELAYRVRNAYLYRHDPIGVKAPPPPPELEFGPVTVTDRRTLPPEEGRRGFHTISFDEALATQLVAAEPLVKGLLDCGALSVVYGESNSGKTFVTLDIALHIGNGLSWRGAKTKHGLVVYVAAEGGTGVLNRLKAWRHRHADAIAAARAEGRASKFHVAPCPINLLDSEADLKALVAEVRRLEAAHGEKVALLVVDTLSRALAGGDENSSVDMGAFVKNVDRVRAGFGCHLLLVHHSGKDRARGARGWSGLRAAVDTEIEIVDRTIKVTKQRDLTPIEDVPFELDIVAVGEDEDGGLVTSCAVEFPAEFEAEIEDDIKETPVLKRVMAAFDAALNLSTNGVVESREWYMTGKAMFDGREPRNSGFSSRDVFRKHRKKAELLGWIEKVGPDQWVSKPGTTRNDPECETRNNPERGTPTL